MTSQSVKVLEPQKSAEPLGYIKETAKMKI